MSGPRLLYSVAALIALASLARADNDFFESKIRPVLVEHCYACHSAEAAAKGKLRGGLKLDTKAGWQKGGDNGAAIVPGKPAGSTLLAAMKFEGDFQMPPKGKLPANVLADFEKWIRDGAADPRTEAIATAKPVGLDLEKGRQFWSLQPVKAVATPTIAAPQVPVRTPIDAFIQAKWAEKGLKPTALADKRTLIRRVTFDLTGLPPTPDEVEAFLKDDSPTAFAKVVDRLLASSAYGERWARHWLDVARYAEDQAHTFAVKPKSNAYIYRDWVIRAFNDDMPFDTFVKRQLAGDLMPDTGGDLFTRVAGLGFLGLGAEYYKNTAREQAIAEELDDRVDVVSRAFLGLTVSCARCHDHKFDPIPTRDYYSLAGLFYGTNLTDTPLVGAEELKKYTDAQARVKDQESTVNTYLNGVGRTAAKDAVGLTAKYLLAARQVRSGKGKPDAIAKQEGLSRYFLDRWMKFLDPANAGKSPAIFKDWFALKTDASADEITTLATAVQKQLAEVPIPDLAPTPKNKTGSKANDPLAKAMFTDQNAPLFVSTADAERLFLKDADKTQLTALRTELEKRKQDSPKAPLLAPTLSGNGDGMKVYVRGNPATKGEDAPKGFLQVIAKTGDKSGKEFTRLDLANRIATVENPLTARVIVNRVWAWHFGRGLVNTPSNFGALGERPTHPELLDHLTAEFVKHGWSIKWLHREILKSSVYALSSNAEFGTRNAESKTGVATPQSELRTPNSGDAANVYLWRGTRSRLDVEAWRDSLLTVSGALDATMGGPTFDLKDANAKRRTVYAKVSRHELDGLLRLFDFPDANVTADKRNITTVPQQQLFALNSEFMVNQAKAFADRVSKLGKTDDERITAAYRLAYNRSPDAKERDFATAFLQRPANKDDKLTRWQQYAQALLASNEMMYVD